MLVKTIRGGHFPSHSSLTRVNGTATRFSAGEKKTRPCRRTSKIQVRLEGVRRKAHEIPKTRNAVPLTGSAVPFISGLTTAIDVLPIRGSGHASEFLTLELSADTQAGLPGRLRRYTSPDATPVVVANCINSPTSMARDERTGALYITEIFTGRIVKVAAP